MTFASLFLLFVLSLSAFSRDVSTSSHPLPSLNLTTVRQGDGRVMPCGEDCRFRLCSIKENRVVLSPNRIPFVILRAPNRAVSPFICRPGRTLVGPVLSVGEAQISFPVHAQRGTGTRFVNISRWRPQGLPRSIRFPGNYFSVAQVPYFPFSGISRRKTRPELNGFLHDRCVRLPISSYQVITGPRRIATGGVVRLSPNPNNCVAFRTTAPAIHIELVWDTVDDLDLSVIEPDSDLLDSRTTNLRTEYGKLLMGANVACPRPPERPFGQENIVYFPNRSIERGEYQVRVMHSHNCDPRRQRPTLWRLTVVKNGVAVKTLFGLSSGDDGTQLVFLQFRYP